MPVTCRLRPVSFVSSIRAAAPPYVSELLAVRSDGKDEQEEPAVYISPPLALAHPIYWKPAQCAKSCG